MRIHLLVLFLFAINHGNFAGGYNILGVFPHVGGSHHHSFLPLILGLAEKGHNVTIISHFPQKEAPPTYKDIQLKIDRNVWSIPEFSMEYFNMHRFVAHIVSSKNLFAIGFAMCQLMLENPEVQNLQKGEYDVILIEQFNSDCGLGIAHKLEAPFVGITSHAVMSWTTGRVSALENPSHVPSHYFDFGKHPDFFGVLESIFVESFYKWAYYFFSQIPERWLMSYYFDDLPALEDIARNMSLILVSTYFPLNGAVPLAPNYVEVGGMHLKKKGYIPDDTLEFLDKSENGVILFSMGSMLQSSSWPEDKLKAFQSVLSQMPQNVLWKWDNITMDNLPPNVRLEKWIAQFDILHHKNVKAFITHAGMLGMTEAAHCGVPVISIPMYGDQFYNAACARDSGLGVVLNYNDINEETIREALNTVLEPSFYKQAKKFSEIFRDRPQSPLETAMYWVEHVARHGGKHLRPLLADVPLYRYLLLDVILFLFLCTSIPLYVLWKCSAKRNTSIKTKRE